MICLAEHNVGPKKITTTGRARRTPARRRRKLPMELPVPRQQLRPLRGVRHAPASRRRPLRCDEPGSPCGWISPCGTSNSPCGTLTTTCFLMHGQEVCTGSKRKLTWGRQRATALGRRSASMAVYYAGAAGVAVFVAQPILGGPNRENGLEKRGRSGTLAGLARLPDGMSPGRLISRDGGAHAAEQLIQRIWLRKSRHGSRSLCLCRPQFLTVAARDNHRDSRIDLA